MVDSLRELLFPARCAFCATAGAETCAGCLRDLPWNALACPRCARPQAFEGVCAACARRPPPFDAAWTAFVHAPPIREQVLGLKYHGRLLQATQLARLLAPRLPSRPALILPVPLHVGRLLGRGYNQAWELARALGRETGIPAEARRLRRLRATEAQTGQSARRRRENLKGAFAVEGRLDGLHVALLDDVMTTGATLSELARVVRAAGAARIEAWAVARTP